MDKPFKRSLFPTGNLAKDGVDSSSSSPDNSTSRSNSTHLHHQTFKTIKATRSDSNCRSQSRHDASSHSDSMECSKSDKLDHNFGNSDKLNARHGCVTVRHSEQNDNAANPFMIPVTEDEPLNPTTAMRETRSKLSTDSSGSQLSGATQASSLSASLISGSLTCDWEYHDDEDSYRNVDPNSLGTPPRLSYCSSADNNPTSYGTESPRDQFMPRRCSNCDKQFVMQSSVFADDCCGDRNRLEADYAFCSGECRCSYIATGYEYRSQMKFQDSYADVI